MATMLMIMFSLRRFG